MSPQEAEAVIELWAKRQQDLETEQSMPKVQDLAEAISVPPQEVEGLLREVRLRMSQRSPRRLPARRRVFLFVLLAVSVCAFWIAAMAGFYNYAYHNGAEAVRWQVEPALMDATAPGPPMPIAVDVAPTEVPSGLTATFRKYSLVGTGTRNMPRELVESQLFEALNGILHKMAQPLPVDQDISPSEGLSNIIEALQADGGKNTERYIIFEPFEVSAGDKKLTQMIPLALTSNSDIVRLVEAEQQRRIRVLANAGSNLTAGR